MRPHSRADHAVPRDLAAAAWLLVVPCAAVTIALVVLLGPPLSHVLYPQRASFTVLPTVPHRPEPVEGTRYALALIGPLLLAGGIALLAPRLRIPRRGAALAAIVQLAAAALVAASVVESQGPAWGLRFFRPTQFAGAALMTVAVALAARRTWLAAPLRSRAAQLAAPLVALALTGVWFLAFVFTADSISLTGDSYNTGFVVDETFAVLNGLTPLVDHAAAYGSLWPYLFAAALSAFGETLLVYTILTWALSVAMLLGIYDVLRRATRSPLGALALYLPVMAFTFFGAVRDLGQPTPIYQQVPLRTAGPFLVAWLVARRLDRGKGATWPLMLVAGLVIVNNVESGLAAFGATLAALLWAGAGAMPDRLRQLAASTALGLTGALAIAAALTLARAGALPDPARAVAFARIYGQGGVGLSPLPHVLGLPLVVYLTYAAALAVATVRAVERAPNRVLTGMLAWSGVFGFGAGFYYIGASVPTGVPTLFPPWALSLALLAIVAVQRLARDRRRLPSMPALAALFGIGLLGTFVLLPPTRLAPWAQLERIRTRLPPGTAAAFAPLAAPDDRAFARFVGTVADDQGRLVIRDQAPVAILWSTGHLIARAYRLRDVVPYIGESVYTVEQLDDALRRLAAAGGNTLLVAQTMLPRVGQALLDRGFAALTPTGFESNLQDKEIVVRDGLTKWVDTRAVSVSSSRSPARPPRAR